MPGFLLSIQLLNHKKVEFFGRPIFFTFQKRHKILPPH